MWSPGASASRTASSQRLCTFLPGVLASVLWWPFRDFLIPSAKFVENSWKAHVSVLDAPSSRNTLPSNKPPSPQSSQRFTSLEKLSMVKQLRKSTTSKFVFESIAQVDIQPLHFAMTSEIERLELQLAAQGDTATCVPSSLESLRCRAKMWEFLELFRDFWRFLELFSEFWRLLSFWRLLELLSEFWRRLSFWRLLYIYIYSSESSEWNTVRWALRAHRRLRLAARRCPRAKARARGWARTSAGGWSEQRL